MQAKRVACAFALIVAYFSLAGTKRYGSSWVLHPDLVESGVVVSSASVHVVEIEDTMKIGTIFSSVSNSAESVDFTFKMTTPGGVVFEPKYAVRHRPGKTTHHAYELKNLGTNTLDSVIVNVYWSRKGSAPKNAFQFFIFSSDVPYDPERSIYTRDDDNYVVYTKWSRRFDEMGGSGLSLEFKAEEPSVDTQPPAPKP